MILDVGCRDKKRGDIGVDIEKFDSVDVIASIEALPFVDSTFTVARSSHTLEHVDNPEGALKEMLRVSGGYVIMIVPHRRGSAARNPDPAQHKWAFNKAWFGKFALKHNCVVSATYTYEPFLGIFSRPYEVIVELWNNGKGKGK